MNLIRIAYKESWLSVIYRFFRSLRKYLHKPKWANHYCAGESGSGEWSYRTGYPSICGYCKEPMKKPKGEG